MPRKIPGLEEKIVQTACQLFVEKGFSEISMKDVAALVGTSVGNLYNYYPSKKDLFLAGRKLWTERFRADFLSLEAGGADPRQTLDILLTRIMDTLETWAGLWEEFLASANRELKPDEIKFLLASMRQESRSTLIEPLDKLLRQVCVGNAHLERLLAVPDLRFATSILSTIKMLIRLYPNQKADNRAFIGALIDLKTHAQKED